jgi:Flp pilus assembly protein TadG
MKMARARILFFLGNRSGAAAAEMALIMPLLLVLMFGAFETGKFFLDAHTVSKAVRDGARFAARQPFAEMPCGGAAAREANIRDLVRTGTTDGSGDPRLSYWSDPATITVTIICDTAGSYSSASIYATAPGGARNVTVSADVPYDALLGFAGIDTSGLRVRSRSQAAVMGI